MIFICHYILKVSNIKNSSYLVKSSIGEDVDAETLGGASTHSEISGVTDNKYPNDKACLDAIKNVMDKIIPGAPHEILLVLDGSTGQNYWIVGLMTEKSFGERLSVFLNFENFLGLDMNVGSLALSTTTWLMYHRPSIR